MRDPDGITFEFIQRAEHATEYRNDTVLRRKQRQQVRGRVSSDVDIAEVDMAQENIIDHLFNIFARHGVRSYQGGGVSMAEHMLQTAVAAEGAASAPNLVAAALLHDVGHFSTDFAELETDPKHAAMLNATIDRRHEESGARLLQPFFPPDVLEPIRLHVQAKRYLCAIEHDYLDTLSPQARHTLRLQGGPMSSEEITAFEANPYGRAAAIIRRWDDAAIVPGLETRDFEHYRPLLERLLKA